MNTLIRLFVVAVLMTAAGQGWANPQTSDFSSASKAFVEGSKCGTPKLLGEGKDHGEMQSCVMGDGRTVVWEIEKSRTDESVHRIRFTWFDFGVDDPTEAKVIKPHIDEFEAGEKLDAFLDAYAPCLKDRMRDNFFESVAGDGRNKDGMRVSVKHFNNPSLVERVVEIYPSTSVD